MSRTFSSAAASAGLAALLAVGCSEDRARIREVPVEPGAAPTSTVEASHGANPPTVTPQQSGTTNRLQAVSPVNSQVVWASGVGGTFVLTTDGGNTWKAGVVPGAEALQFRDVEGVSEKVAYLMAAGVRHRLAHLQDGGRRCYMVAAVPGRGSGRVLRLLRVLEPEPRNHLRRRDQWALPRHPHEQRKDVGRTSATRCRGTAGRGRLRGERHLHRNPG